MNDVGTAMVQGANTLINYNGGSLTPGCTP